MQTNKFEIFFLETKPYPAIASKPWELIFQCYSNYFNICIRIWTKVTKLYWHSYLVLIKKSECYSYSRSVNMKKQIIFVLETQFAHLWRTALDFDLQDLYGSTWLACNTWPANDLFAIFNATMALIHNMRLHWFNIPKISMCPLILIFMAMCIIWQGAYLI